MVISDSKGAESLPATVFDVVVFQRPARTQMLSHITRLQAAGIAVVIDMDDDFSALPSNNAAFKSFHPKYSPESNWQNIEKACRLADLVTVSTASLAERYGSHGRVRVLPNYVPSWYLRTDAHREDVTVGWSGDMATHPGDLEVTRGAVQRALEGTDAKFGVVGIGNGVRDALDLSSEPDKTGWCDIGGEYQRAIAELSIGIVPLASHAFNRGKSWLKGLEYSSVGVPFIATGTPEYLKLYEQGAGLIANKPRQWETQLRQLITDDAYRTEMGERGREVASKLTIEDNAWRFIEAWQDAYLNRNVRRVA